MFCVALRRRRSGWISRLAMLFGRGWWKHAAFLFNRGEGGHDGNTSYGRCKGKRGRLPGLAFAVKLLWKKRLKRQTGDRE